MLETAPYTFREPIPAVLPQLDKRKISKQELPGIFGIDCEKAVQLKLVELGHLKEGEEIEFSDTPKTHQYPQEDGSILESDAQYFLKKTIGDHVVMVYCMLAGGKTTEHFHGEDPLPIIEGYYWIAGKASLVMDGESVELSEENNFIRVNPYINHQLSTDSGPVLALITMENAPYVPEDQWHKQTKKGALVEREHVLYEAFPRGLCAGVVKAVDESEEFIRSVRRENPNAKIFYVGYPAHNTHIINRFRDMGVSFVNHISEAEDDGYAIFGPHGSTEEDIEIARTKGMTFLNTECPLVTKVKEEIKERTMRGVTSLYHGKRGHAETRATMSVGEAVLFETREEALAIAQELKSRDPNIILGYSGQTTHNADRSREIAEEVKRIAPDLEIRNVSSQCFATRDRQAAVREMVRCGAKAVIVVGSPESSNSRELANVAQEEGAKRVFFVDDVDDLPAELLREYSSFGLTAGASVEEDVIERVRGVILQEGQVQEVVPVVVADESRIKFKQREPQVPLLAIR